MKRMLTILVVISAIVILSNSMIWGQPVTRNVPTPYATIQNAIDAANAGDIINIAAGTYTLTASVNVTKANLTIQGASNTTTIIQGASTMTGYPQHYFFHITSNGVTIQNMQMVKTDKPGEHNILFIDANNITIQNNIISGQYVFGDGDVSRGMEVAYGMSGMLIQNNTFNNLRQPAYINGNSASPSMGTIANNYTYNTKGWVLAGSNVTFTGNTWGINVFDIAILVGTDASYCSPITTVSAANNDAVIDDQRVSPDVLSVVYVDAATSNSSDLGGRYHPYSTISPTIARVAAGGKIFVAHGHYAETVTITKSLSLLGAQAGIDPRGGARTEGSPTESIVDGSSTRTEGIFVQGVGETNRVTNVVIDGFEVHHATYANVRFDYANNVTLKNMMVHHCTTNEGVKTKASCTSLLIQKVISHNNEGDGFELGDYGTQTNHIMEDCESYNNSDRGIYIVSTANTTVRRCKSYGNLGTVSDWHQGGIIAYQNTGLTITDAECYNNMGSGIYLYKDNYAGATSTVISGSTKCYNNIPNVAPNAITPGDGIMIYLSHNVTVDGLEAYGNARHGMLVGTVGQYGDLGGSDYCNNIVIRNCNLHNNTADGIAFLGIGTSNCSATPNNSIVSNTQYGIFVDIAPLVTPINATQNWWGNGSGPYHLSLNPTGTGNQVSDKVSFDPWTGKPVQQVITSASTGHLVVVSNTNVTLDFTSLPAGTNATITIQQTPSLPAGIPAPPAVAGAVAPFCLLLGATGLTNGTFTCTVTIDVSAMTGFTASTQVMYYSTISNSWVGVHGTYDGVAHTYTFTTDHFTPFVFANPGNPINLYITTDNANTGKNYFYPQVGMGSGLTYGLDDWTYVTPKCTLYVVPTGTQGVVAANFRILYDNTKASLDAATEGTLFTGGAFFQSSPGAGQLLIQTSNLDPAINVVPGSDKYLARLIFTILKPGYNSIGLDDLDFRYYNAGIDAQNSVYVTNYPGAIKFYLGDIASTGFVTTTGDGVVGFDDLSPFSLAYWSTTGTQYYQKKFDIGPTTNSGYFAMPVPDGKVEFEDLVIFSIGYGKYAAGQLPKRSTQPITLATMTPLPQADGTIRVPITVSGAVVDVRALSLNISYPSTMAFVRVEKAGECNNDYSFMKSKTENGTLMIDAAIMGLEHKGLSNAGVIAYAVFNGTGNVGIEQVRARNSANNPIGVTIENSGSVPSVYALSQNYPNPFNPTTTIRYELPKDAQVKIVIYNMLGEEVVTLVNSMQSSGSYTATWNGANGHGETVSSGMYIYKMTAGDYISIKKMVMMK